MCRFLGYNGRSDLRCSWAFHHFLIAQKYVRVKKNWNADDADEPDLRG